MGGKSKREGVYVYVWLIHCTATILQCKLIQFFLKPKAYMGTLRPYALCPSYPSGLIFFFLSLSLKNIYLFGCPES